MQKMKNKQLRIFLGIIFIVWLMILWILYPKSNYTIKNYFLENKKVIEEIVSYIDSNDLTGSIHSNYNYQNNWNTWNLYKKCIIDDNCLLSDESFFDLIFRLNIEYIVAYRSNWTDVDLQWIHFYLQNNITIDSLNDKYIYYSKWFYRNKEIWDSYDWNSMHVIVEIFNNDWWVINGCYWCWWGWWD